MSEERKRWLELDVRGDVASQLVDVVDVETATLKPKAQRNFTYPDSKIMLTDDGAFHQCYNAQAVVDEDPQVIVATELDTNASDVGTLRSR